MATENNYRKPVYRKLRGYAFDPSTSLDMDTSEINEIIYKVPWEEGLTPGPCGEYVEIIDHDPVSKATYIPVDLNDPKLLAMDGLPPSETNPQFHQQMVYAVIMTTIKNFEKALGRKVLWSAAEIVEDGKLRFEYVPKLLVFPHGMRDQNAFYSPDRKVLLFGYYNAEPVDAGLYLPGGIVYSCLSHDIIAHETTHALLDGMYSRFMEVTHPDVPAFHEGFADMVALVQHFTQPAIVRNQIRKVKGDLNTDNLLGKLAVEFGQSTGQYSALRIAIGQIDEDGHWTKTKPSLDDYSEKFECHDRGGLLVSTVFDAYLAIYQRRTADLLRIATGGSGVIGEGDIHPDLVNRLAAEASKTASHVLSMCIRALDYCPPVDMNYGDYLRALITADAELVEEDDLNYRIAFINAFRKRGIFPEGVPNLSVETLCYNYREKEADKEIFKREVKDFLRAFQEKMSYVTDRKEIFTNTTAFIRGDSSKDLKGLHAYLFGGDRSAESAYHFENLTGLVFTDQYRDLGIRRSKSYGMGPSIEIHSVRLHNRIGPDGSVQDQLIMTLCQRCVVRPEEMEDGSMQFHPVLHRTKNDADRDDLMTFRGGCTLIFDLNGLELKHVISKPIFDPCDLGKGRRRKLTLNQARLEMQYKCQVGDLVNEIGFAPVGLKMVEPFNHIHQAKTTLL